jgi:hypothetical protein
VAKESKMVEKSLRIEGLLAVIGALGVLVAPGMSPRAKACGGFWCSQQAPVNQSAEQIIFVDHPDETVTAVIQIQYVGPSEKFAWVVPIPGNPDISVSSNLAFQALANATDPQYVLEPVIEGMCMQDFRGFPGDFAGAPSAGTSAPPPAMSADPAVTVVAMGSVGPYDYTVISLNPQLAEPADVAIDWFMTEGYDLTGIDADVLGPYLESGLNLLAFRLTKGPEARTGSIRPVILTYESELPMIPIRPTAVAAQDDMGIRVWVAAEQQAVPENYKSLVINEALINWFNYRQNYDAVVTAAANEAQGQGFVTELAGSTEQYDELVYSAAQEMQWATLNQMQFADGIDAIWAANSYYRGWDGWRETIEATVTLPQGVTFDMFARTPDVYRGMAQVDAQEFMTELYTRVVQPVEETQRLLSSRPYLTRLYSTMSAEEMTVDPAFTYNADLADVSNRHVAKQFIECSPEITQFEAPWRIELPQGGMIRGVGSQNGWPVALDALPANLKIVQLSTSGSGEIVMDNSGEIGDVLFELVGDRGTGAAVPEPPNTGVMIGGDQTIDMMGTGEGSEAGGSDSGLCAVSAPGKGGRASSLLLLLLGSILPWVRRRR